MQRRQHDARGRRRRADHALHEERHVGDRPEHRHPDERHARDAAGDDRVPQELERQDRLARAPLDDGEQREQQRPQRPNAPSTCGARPRVLLAAPDEPEQQRAGADSEQPGAEPVDRVVGRGARRGIVSEITTRARPPTGRLTRKTQRQLALSTMNPPTAGPMIDDGGEDRADQPLPAAAVARRDDVADHGERQREQPACADSLDGAEDDQLRSSSSRGRRAPSRPGRRRSRRGRGSCGPRRRRASRRAAP